MSWLLPRLRPGSALRLGAGRHALPALGGGSDAALWASPLQALIDGQAAYVACSQQARRLADGSQPAKPVASAEEEARLRKVRWRQWADEQLQQRPADAPVEPLPVGLADNMSPEVAAAVQRQEPFLRRPPSSAAQQPAAQQPSTAEAQPVSQVHPPAGAEAMAAAEGDAADLREVADATATVASPSAEASLAQRLGLRDLASNAGERIALQTAALDEQSGAAERGELSSVADSADAGTSAEGDGAFAAAARQAAAEQVAMAEAQVEANPGGVEAALQQRDELLSGGSTQEAAEAAGLEFEVPEQAAQQAADAADVALEGAVSPQGASAPEPSAALQREAAVTQQRPGQRQASAEWDAFVAAQAAAQAGQGAPQQPAAAAPPEAEAQPPPQHQRAFRGQTTQLFGPGPDPRTGYSALAAREGEGLPLPYAPPRLHPTRDFFPGQFYRPADLNPFVPAETSQYAPASRRIEQAKPTAAEAMAAADYRNVGFLARFMTDTGRIVARRRSGLQAKVHRRIARQIKVAKMMALAPIDSRPPVGHVARPVAPQGGRRGGPAAARGSHSAAAAPAAASTDDEDEL